MESSILRLILELQSGLLYSHNRSSEYSRIGGGGGGGGGRNGISQFTSLLSDLESSSKIMAALVPFLQRRWRHKAAALIGILNDQTSSPSLITSSAGGTAALTAISHKLRPAPRVLDRIKAVCSDPTTPWRPPGPAMTTYLAL